MSFDRSSRTWKLVSAVALVIVLAGTLAARVAARIGPASGLEGPRATVPLPEPFDVADLPTPFCWGCSSNQNAALEFQIDLDLLAPLGTGSQNAADWFARFAKHETRSIPDGRTEYRDRLIDVEIAGRTWTVLPEDDALLLEAEPWVDQARCSFYPDVWEVSGPATELPNLLLAIDLARSWTARGKRSADPDQARDDFRRAMRLGRLLRQDDVTIIQDLVAIACIRIGAEAMYELARGESDAATMLATALVLSDKDAMRQITARRITLFEPALDARRAEDGTLSLGLTDRALDSIIEAIRKLPDRRFRMEGTIALHSTQHIGTPEQRERAAAALAELTGDEDPMVAAMASRFRDTILEGPEIEALLEGMGMPPKR